MQVACVCVCVCDDARQDMGSEGKPIGEEDRQWTTCEDLVSLAWGFREKSDGKSEKYFGVYFLVPESTVLCSLKVIL